MRLLPAVLLLALLTGCREFDNPYDPDNRQPPVPANPVPADGASRQDTVGLVLRWSCADSLADDTLVFDLHFGTAAEPPAVDTGLTVSFWACGRLDTGRTYHWRVVARDLRGRSATGPVWRFTTSPNLPPLAPSSPQPFDGRTGLPTSVRLSWQGGDPNPGDTVVFDLYLGRADPPPLVAAGLAAADWTAAGLDPDAEYFWSVVARDQDSAETAGPVWRFATMGRAAFARPAGGERWLVGSSQPVRWQGGAGEGRSQKSEGRRQTSPFSSIGRNETGDGRGGGGRFPVFGPGSVKRLLAADSSVLYHSPDSGASWRRVGRASVPGEYEWVVSGPPATAALLQVRVFVGRDIESATSNRFTTYAEPAPLVVTDPAEGARWSAGEQRAVLWEGGGAGMDSTVVDFSHDNGRTWARQGRATEPGRFDWLVPGPATESAYVRVRAHFGPDTVAGQSGRFTVLDLVPVNVTAPAAGERWRAGERRLVIWSGGSPGMDSTVVDFSHDNGRTWARQGRATEPGRFDWLVPGPATESAYVRVRTHYGPDTAAGRSGRFAIFTPAPDTVRATITVGAKPVSLAWNGLNNRLYVVNNESRTISVIDGTSNRVIDSIRVGSLPGAIAWDSVRNRVYVANEGDRSVTVIEGATNWVIATVPVGARPSALAVDPAGGLVYVANQNSDTVSVIDAASNSVVASVPVGRRPRALAWNRLNNRIYAACADGNSVTVIDGETHAVLDSVPVGPGPVALLVVEDRNHVYVANSGSGGNSVTVIDAADNRVIATVPVGARPLALDWNRSANTVYAVAEGDSSVTVIRTGDRQPAATIAVGSLPAAVLWAAGVNTAYVACRGSAEVVIINGESNQVERRLLVGAAPVALAWNPAGPKIYVANRADGTVSVIGAR